MSWPLMANAPPNTLSLLSSGGRNMPVASDDPPGFRLWQARLLLDRDCLYWAFVLVTYAAYIYKAIPHICSTGPAPAGTAVDTLSVTRQEWPYSWQLVCGDLTNAASDDSAVAISLFPSTLGPLAASAVECTSSREGLLQQAWCAAVHTTLFGATKTIRAAIYALQALTIMFGLGWLDPALSHYTYCQLRVTLGLWLIALPIPYLNVCKLWPLLRGTGSGTNSHDSSSEVSKTTTCSSYSSARSSDATCSISSYASDSSAEHGSHFVQWYQPSWYWKRPLIRQTAVVLFRLWPVMVMAATTDSIYQRFPMLSSMHYAFTGWWYLYVGWSAWMLVLLPAKLHLTVSCIEWLLAVKSGIHIDALITSNTSGSIKGWYSMFNMMHQLFLSFALIVLLPSLGVVWLDHSHKDKFVTATQLWQQHERGQRQQRMASVNNGSVSSMPTLSTRSSVPSSVDISPISTTSSPGSHSPVPAAAGAAD